MAKTYDRVLFIFRRDLRLADNTALIHALKDATKVYPIFIFTPEQVTRNPFKSNNAIQFMVESLDDLDKQLKKKGARLNLFYGNNDTITKRLIKQYKLQAVYLNNDYTKFSKQRDKKIHDLCKKLTIDFYSFEDVCLQPVNTVRTQQDTCYLKFTPFLRAAKKYDVRLPMRNAYSNYHKGSLTDTLTLAQAAKRFYTLNQECEVEGGRQHALRILRNLKQFKDYNKTRNIPSINTTLLSAHNKFGTVSIREVYYAIADSLGSRTDLIKQLYWRDFYYNLMDNYPDLLRKSLKPDYDKIKWKTNARYFAAWKEGMTGFPLVDAGMRQMNMTGFMHNRARLVVASLLCKVLLLNWRKGEKYFAQTLVDYDPAQNNGNWAWCSGAGADAQPYFRVFNPFLQSKRFDPDCVYIKEWIPELEEVPNNHIHKWNEWYDEYDEIDYPGPIVDYAAQKKKGLTMYKRAV